MPAASSGPWTSVGSARLLSEAFEMFSTPEEHWNLARKRPCLSFSFLARGLGALFLRPQLPSVSRCSPLTCHLGGFSASAGAAVCICDVAPWNFSLEAAAVLSDHSFLCHSINVLLLLFLMPNIFK